MATNLTPVFINQQTINNAKNNIYKITITTNSDNYSVNGYLTNEFQIRTDAKWDPIFTTDGFMADAQKFGGFNGLGIFNTGFWSQLYFKNGGYIVLNPEFRIVDWGESEASTSPTVYAAMVLTSCCIPKGGPGSTLRGLEGMTSLDGALKRFKQMGKDALFNGLAFAQGGADFISDAVDAAVSVSPERQQQARKTVGKVDLSAFLSRSPSTVSVEVGSLFRNNEMIVEAVDCKFSKEMTRRGPLYVDVKLELKTLKRPRNDAGLLSFSDKKRVSTTDSQNRQVINNPTNPKINVGIRP